MDEFLLWLGTESALSPYLAAQRDPGGARLSGFAQAEDDAEEKPYAMAGKTAIIKINGSLTNRESWFNSLVGLRSYGSIRNAVVAAANDKAVSAIVLDIDSGGGTVAGVMDAANVIREVDRRIKPVHAFTAGSMHSAAYFLGAAARSITITDLASVGSIGAIMVHFDVTEQMKNEGVKPTVIRSAELKAIGNPFEKLTEERRAILQGQIDYVHGIFVGHVATQRGLEREFVASRLATGGEFMGQQAVTLKAVDKIATLDSLVENLNRKADNSPRTAGMPLNPSAVKADSNLVTEDHMAKKTLSAAAQAAVLEGADPAIAAAVAPAAPEATPENPEASASANPAPTAAATPATISLPEAQAAAGIELKAEPAADPAVVEFLRTELAAANAKITASAVEKASLEAELSALKASVPAMRQIVASSYSRMVVSLGGSALDVSAVPDETLLQMHSKTLAQFNEKFKVGGVVETGDAAATASSENPGTPVVRPGLLKAVRTK